MPDFLRAYAPLPVLEGSELWPLLSRWFMMGLLPAYKDSEVGPKPGDQDTLDIRDGRGIPYGKQIIVLSEVLIQDPHPLDLQPL